MENIFVEEVQKEVNMQGINVLLELDYTCYIRTLYKGIKNRLLGLLVNIGQKEKREKSFFLEMRKMYEDLEG